MSGATQTERYPWQFSWPIDGLQQVDKCPVCACESRNLLHGDLVDNVFYIAPGRWSLWSCTSCGAAYIDPRPDQKTIHLAYSNYYTHSAGLTRVPYESLSRIGKLRRRIMNGYTNWRYSTREEPTSKLGIPLLLMLWPLRQRLASEYRHLPRCPPSGGALLDVGCGSGGFLRIARSAGWDVTGIDPDPKAVSVCHSQGLNVLQGGLEQLSQKERLFDVITLNHVIEHVHAPVAALESCHRLLKPGGRLWLATPNIGSLGHRRYGRHWRGLEPPRHLVLFDQNSLRTALGLGGFCALANKPDSKPLRSMTMASEAIRRGLPIEETLPLSTLEKKFLISGRVRQAISPALREFLTVTATKANA